ncbi:MAG: hypothetical protein WD342_17140 [Verrucomicrobiales bacterium]
MKRLAGYAKPARRRRLLFSLANRPSTPHHGRMAHDTFRIGDLTAVIGDNAAHEDHRPGYNGVWELRHKTGTRSLFVPSIAGLNFEHIFSGQFEDDRDVFFEPRRAPMSFRKLGEDACELHQPPTPTFHLESWTRFNLVAPHYLDMTFRCQPTQHVFEHGYIGLFWASYIHGPLDKSMYFVGGLQNQKRNRFWSQLCTQAHNDESTVRHRDDDVALTFDDDSREALYKNFSPMRFDLPLFYGNFEEHVWIVMFDRLEGIRLTHSPSGGGATPERKTTNPAWDFQFIIPDYDVLESYSFRVRTVFRPKCSRDDVLKEYADWKESPSGV